MLAPSVLLRLLRDRLCCWLQHTFLHSPGAGQYIACLNAEDKLTHDRRCFLLRKQRTLVSGFLEIDCSASPALIVENSNNCLYNVHMTRQTTDLHLARNGQKRPQTRAGNPAASLCFGRRGIDGDRTAASLCLAMSANKHPVQKKREIVPAVRAPSVRIKKKRAQQTGSLVANTKPSNKVFLFSLLILLFSFVCSPYKLKKKAYLRCGEKRNGVVRKPLLFSSDKKPLKEISVISHYIHMKNRLYRLFIFAGGLST